MAERSDGGVNAKAAIKLLRADADRGSFRDAFCGSAALANLNHPSIARLMYRAYRRTPAVSGDGVYRGRFH
jgi:hypothetical protein